MLTAKNDGVGCARCGDPRPPVRAPRITWAIIPLAWAALLLVGAGSALLLPLNMVLIPCWLACASAIGALSRTLLDPKCGACGEPRGSDVAVAKSERSREPAVERLAA